MDATAPRLLDTWRDLFRSAAERTRALLGRLDAAQLGWKPDPQRWSVGECVDHVVLSIETYLPLLQRTIAKALAKGRTGSEPYARGTLLGRFILSVLRAGPQKRRVTAPKVFKPRVSGHERAALLARADAAYEEIVRHLEDADGLALGRVKFGTPVSRLVRVSLAQAFEIHALHAHRHLDQAERVEAEAGFPPS